MESSEVNTRLLLHMYSLYSVAQKSLHHFEQYSYKNALHMKF